MANQAFCLPPRQTGKGLGAGLPHSMTHEQIAMARDHIATIWWPQLCRSSRKQSMVNTGMFEQGWYDDNGLLDIYNPALWKILNALGALYGKIHHLYPDDAIQTFRVRWQAARDEDMVYLRAEGLKSDNDARLTKGFRIKSPRSGWLDFQMELDVLKARRDAADATLDPADAAIAPRMVIAGNGTLVHSAPFRPTGGPAFSCAQQKDIAEKVAVALAEEPTAHERSRSTTDHSSTKDPKCTSDHGDQDPYVDDPNTQQPGPSSLAGPSTDLEILNEVKDVKGEGRNSPGHGYLPRESASSPIAATQYDSDVEELSLDQWVNVGEDDELDDFMVPTPNSYEYKKGDAKSGRRGWFQGWLY